MNKNVSFIGKTLPIAISGVLLSGCLSSEEQSSQTQKEKPPVAVETTTIQSQSVTFKDELPGRLSAYKKAEIRPQVDGIVTNRLFEEGSYVEKGDVLYQIDDAQYQASYYQAEAALAKAEANLYRTTTVMERSKNLIENKAISQQDFDNAEANLKEAEASVLAAKAALKRASIDLAYTKIKAPISGVVGRSMVTEGALVSRNQVAEMAVIQQVDPLYVDVSQSGEKLLSLKSAINKTEGKTLNDIQVSLNTGTTLPDMATLQFSDISVDPETGSVIMRAKLPNADRSLMPGLYVRASVPTYIDPEALLVPQEALMRNPDGSGKLYLVDDKNTVTSQIVQVGQEHNGHWVVQSGVDEGDEIIISGIQKVKDGSSVVTEDEESK